MSAAAHDNGNPTLTEKQTDALPIAVRNVTKTYGRVHALDDVSLDVKSGEFLTLLGPSGSGKTTLLMVLAGFTRPDCGSLRFGEDEMIRPTCATWAWCFRTMRFSRT
jgi:putative spermidine/putrescine transport system ATP-binding protein